MTSQAMMRVSAFRDVFADEREAIRREVQPLVESIKQKGSTMTTQPLIYLACPHSADGDLELQAERIVASMRYEEGLVRAGARVFNPLRYSASYDFAADPDYPMPSEDHWRRWGCDLMIGCDIVLVLKLPGWQDSEGVKGELDFAAFADKPIVGRELTRAQIDGYRADQFVADVEFVAAGYRTHLQVAKMRRSS